MRVTAIWAQTAQKPQDRSIRRAEKRDHEPTLAMARHLIRPRSIVLTTADTAQGKKHLFSRQIQVILTSEGRRLGECRLQLSDAMLF